MCVLCLCADAKLGVFHHRSQEGQYKLNYTAAQQACTAEGGSLATYNQLSYAQQVSEQDNTFMCVCVCHSLPLKLLLKYQQNTHSFWTMFNLAVEM